MAKRTKRPQNICEDCKYTWYPRGKDVSPKCPRCGSTNTKVTPPNPLTVALGVIVLMVLILSYLGSICKTGSSMLSTPAKEVAVPASVVTMPSLEVTSPSKATPTSTLVATLPPTLTPIPSSAMGEWTQWNGLAISVERYEVADECRGYGDGPAEGAKLVYIWVAVRNVSQHVVELPSFLVELSGVEKHSGWFGGTVCRYNNESLGNSCWKDNDRLYPGVRCEGWELLEVPEKMQIEGRSAKVLVRVWQKGIYEVGHWQLGKE